MASNLLCFFGIHDWKYTPAVYGGPINEMLAVPISEATRVCQNSKCGKEQFQDVHCLGLKPPQYVKQWHNK